MFGREHGSRTGGGGVASDQMQALDRRERMRQLALERIDLAKDPYFMRNHLGSYECRLCCTVHRTEASYLAHTQGKRHQRKLALRAALGRDTPGAAGGANDGANSISGTTSTAAAFAAQVEAQKARRPVMRIGRPGYRVIRTRDPLTRQHGLRFEIDYPQIAAGLQPRHRFMSAFEQKVEPVDSRYQYLLFAADPYETIAFKIPNREIERDSSESTRGHFHTEWDPEHHTFVLELTFKPRAKHTDQEQQQDDEEQENNGISDAAR